jgi:hypothetical protein
MSEPLDPVTAGLASVLKSLRTRTGLTEERLAGTEIALDTLAGLDSVREFVAAGNPTSLAIVKAVKAAAGSLEPSYSIVADVSLGLELARDLMPDPELYAPDLGRRRVALLANWDRLHELRSAVPAVPKPTLRTLRLEIEGAVFNVLASALTDADSRRPFPAPAVSGADASAQPGPGERATPNGGPDRFGDGTAPPPLVRSQNPLLLEGFRRIAGALRDALVVETGRSGWPHDLRKGSKPVTALSTSYGIKAMLLLEGSLAPDLRPAAEFLSQAASPDGGYKARVQVEPRPEVTATVLDTLHRINGTADFTEQMAAVKEELGLFEKTRPFVLTCLLEASVQLGGHPDLTRSLISDLLSARREYGGVLLWPEKSEEGRAAPEASIAHTARAVRALALALAAPSAAPSPEPPYAEAEAAVAQAAAWLANQQDLSNASEIIDRQLPDRAEQMYVRHFTAAWTVKALVSAGLPTSHPAVSTAVARIWNDYQPDAALWSWSNGDLPVWMTLDAVDALQLAALATTIQPVGFSVS